MMQEKINPANKRLLRENLDLRMRLQEAEETLRAIRDGEVDAVIVKRDTGDQVFSLMETENLYRLMVETMNEVGMAVSPDGTIIYSNNRASVVLQLPAERIAGRNIREFVLPGDLGRFDALLGNALERTASERIGFTRNAGQPMALQVWASCIEQAGNFIICLVGTDLSQVESYQDMIAQLNERKQALHNSRIAAFNLMDDAIEARRMAVREGNRLKAVMEALPIGVAIIDKLGGTVESNPMFDVIWGGHRPDTLSFDDYRKYQAWWVDTGEPLEVMEWASARAVRDGETVLGEMVRIERFNGEQAYVINSAAPINNAEGEVDGCAVAIQDVTPMWNAEQAIRESAGRFELLSMTAGELLKAKDPRAIIETLCKKVMEHLDCQVFFNYIADEAARKLRLNVYGGIPEEEARRIALLDYGSAISGCTAIECRTIVAEHIPTTPDERTDLVRSFGVKAYAAHPLISEDGNMMGTLSFGTKSRETFSEDDLSLMKAVADHVTVALVRRRDGEALRESEKKFRAIFDNMTEGVILHEMLYDEDGSPNDYLVISANPAAGKLLGLGSRDAAGMLATTLFGAPVAPFLHAYHRLLSTGEAARFDTYFAPSDKYFSISTSLISGSRFAVVIEDITGRFLAEEEMRQTLMATTDGIWKRNFITGEVFFSPRYYTMLGYEPDEFPASLDSWKGLIHPDDFDQAMQVHTLFEQGDEDNYANEFRLRAKDGSYRLIRSRGRVIMRDDSGRRLRIIGNHFDVTEEKAMVKMFEETSLLLTTIVDNTDLLIAFLDSDFNFIRVNRSYADAGGNDMSFFPGRNHFSLNPSDNLLEAFREAVATGMPLYRKGESYVYPAGSERGASYWDLSIIPIKDHSGIVKNLVLTFADVTNYKLQETLLLHFNERLESKVAERTEELFETNENLLVEVRTRKLAEDEKERAYADLHTIFNSMSIGMTVISRDHRYISVNRRFAEMVSVDQEELLGKQCFELWDNVICSSGSCPVKNLFFGTIQFPYEYEMKYVNPQGKELLFQFIIMPYFERDGSMAGIISNVIDITEKREILLKLTNIIDDERRNISYELHDDLGQNLTAIGFIMESIRQKTSNPPRWLLDKINETSELVIMAQNKTRSLSKILSPVDIGRDGLRVSLEIMARSMERVYDIKCDISVDDGFEIDDNNIATILFYITREASTNSVKHGKSKNISIHAYRDDTTRGIIIRDDGTGIGKAIADTGIGLRIMKYRSQIIGATFSMENNASGGVEVAVRLPY